MGKVKNWHDGQLLLLNFLKCSYPKAAQKLNTTCRYITQFKQVAIYVADYVKSDG